MALTLVKQNDDHLSDDEAFAVWELNMQVMGCVPGTIKDRRITLGSLGAYLDAPVITATRTQLMQWLARPHLGPKTRQSYKSFFHTFYTLMQDEGHRIDNPAARLLRGKSPRIEANPLFTAEVQQLLDSGIRGRTRMMILLAAYQGFRAVEIASTSGNHIDWEGRRILTVDAKGGFEVWRPLHPAVLKYSLENPERFRRDAYWFPGLGDNEHLVPNSVSNTVSAAMKRAGIHGHRPHQIRAWFATQLMESGADLLTIQNAMRHASPNTLRHYIRPSMNSMDKAMRRLPDLR